MSQARPSFDESQPAFLNTLKINGSRAFYALSIVGVAAIYFAAGKLGLSLASVHTNVSPVWPPTGIALAAVLLLGYRVWPAIFLGALLTNVFTPISVAPAFGIAVGNTLEAVLTGVLLNTFGFRKSLDRARDVLKFVTAASLCSIISATIGNLSLYLAGAASGSSFGSLWMTWWMGDLTGAVVVAPLILTWSTGTDHWLPKERYLEATLLILLLSLSAMATFAGTSTARLPYYPLVRLTIPFLLWASFRLGRRGVTVAVAVLSAFAIWGTATGSGPFATSTPNESLMMLQLFIGSNALTFLFLVTVVEEKRVAERKRRQDQHRLEANLAVTRLLAESPDVKVALDRILPTIGESLGWEFGCVWTPTDDRKELRNVALWQKTAKPKFEEICRIQRFEPGVGLPGRVWSTLEPAWIRDVTSDQNFPRSPYAAAEGLHAAFAFPIQFNEKFLGAVEFFSPEIRKPDRELLAMFAGVGSQIGQFIERKRVEAEIESASLLPKENPSPVIRLAKNGIVSYANPSAQSLLSTWQITIGEPAPEGLATKAREAFEQDARREIELKVGELTYLVNLAPITAAGYINLYFNEITSRKKAEDALQDSERNAKAALEYAEATLRTSPIPLLVLDNDLRVHTANDAFYEVFQVNPDETEGHFVYDLGNGQWNIPRLRELLEEILSQNKGFEDFEITHNFETIGQRTTVLNARRMQAGESSLERIVLVIQDVTDRKRSEKELRHLAAIVETTDDAVVSKNLDGIITSWNPAAERLFGYKAEEVIGRSVTLLIPPDRPDEEPRILARLKRGERIDHYETVRVGKDGRPINVSLTVSPIFDAAGKVIGASKIARDITEQKRAQEEIARLLVAERTARQDAEIASRTKDEFLATLSHELRTPLTAMLGWLTILRAHKLDQKTTEHAIDTIERNAKAQAQLIEDLVDISRIVGGKLNLEVTPTELLPVVNAAVEVVKPAADAKEITIDVNYDTRVGPVAGDAARLQQIIWNLLSNAVKFTPKGGRVSVDFGRAGGFAELVVRDTGIGISADFLPHVFERFRQAESSATRSHRGMGLGLAIVRHLMELHGGTVTAASDGENQGSVFTMHLPLATVEKRRATATLAHKSNGEEDRALQGLRILLVEDEPDARELIAMVLQSSGAEVEAVDSAKGALETLTQFVPDVLVSDIGLPLESGYDLIRKVRALTTDINKIPAIALTAFATENDRKLSLSAGFQAHLAKPVEPSNLVKTVNFVINGKAKDQA